MFDYDFDQLHRPAAFGPGDPATGLLAEMLGRGRIASVRFDRHLPGHGSCVASVKSFLSFLVFPCSSRVARDSGLFRRSTSNMTAILRRQAARPSLPLWLLAIAVATSAAFHLVAHAQSGTVTIVGVAAYHSSVKVYFRPVPGAKDYRVYDVTSPNNVKYAGWAHLTASPNCPGSGCFHHFVVQSDGVTPVFPYQVANGASGGPQVLDVPALQIDWNSVGDGLAHALVVEAVDMLGPAPQGSLYAGSNSDNVPLVNPLPAGAMLGMNKGATPDGKISTNGQGPYTNRPAVIAASAPFVVQANRSFRAIPSRPSAIQTFFDTFENAEGSTIRLVTRNDAATDQFGNLGFMKYSMNAGTSQAWEMEYRQANNRDSMPFISADHFMDMIFDGATPGVPAPTHTLYGSMAMSPAQTFDITGGKIAHIVMEVDGHQSFRRWMSFQVAPAADPLQGFDSANHQINNADQAIFLELRDGICTLDIYTGPKSATDRVPTGTAGGSAHGARLWGLAGSSGGAPIMCGAEQMYVTRNFSKNGIGHDDKSRYDFFISQTHAALFQDGQLIVQSDIPAGSFPWSGVPLRAYFSHYLYHSDNDDDELTQFDLNGANMCYPMNSYWFNDPQLGTAANQTICNRNYPAGYGFPFSDERHWDNMGFEVLPATEAPANNFSVLASVVQHPPTLPAQGAGPLPSAPTNVRIIRTAAAGLKSFLGGWLRGRSDPIAAAHVGHGDHSPQGSAGPRSEGR
jgi:hypothetical protein